MKNIIFLLELQDSEEVENNFFKFIIEKFKEINEYFELVNLLWIAIVIIVICLLLLFNKHRVNKKSKKEYEKNERNGKFINELYIELGNCNEKLRYMYFNKKWKSRIKKEFKLILKTNIGKMLSKECNIKFYDYITFNGLYKSMKKCSDYLENCWKRNVNKEENQNYKFYLAMNSYYIKDDILRLLDNVEMINNNICFLLGKAGSGKTNLLTNFAKTLICKFKAQCIYIDAKDIVDNNVEGKVLSYFHVNYIITENRNFLIWILFLLKRIFNQEVVIIIEAINENSNYEFYKNLCRFFNKYHKYRNIKIIVSSRTEFYNLRFKEIFDEYLEKNVQYKIISVENSRISDNIYEKMYLKYKKYFKFNGVITNSVKRTLFESPIFLRIFFECYENSNENISDLNKSKIFSEYISRLSKKYNELNKMLDEIINVMIEDKKFDNVKIDKLNITIDKVQNLISENFLLSHSIVENDGNINEIKSEVISITYDEIRDYLITNNIINKYNENKINLMDFIDEMINRRYPILEGVLKRLYLYFKQNDRKICNYILKKKILINHNYGNSDTYNNAHLDFIFSARQDLNEEEKKYLSSLKYITPNDLAKMTWDCTYNLVYGLLPGVEFIQNEMKKFINREKTIYDFSRITFNSYRVLIQELEKYDDIKIKQYVEIVRELLKYLEMNYYEEDSKNYY